MKQRILTLYHIFNLEFSTISALTGISETEVKNTVDSYNKPFREEDTWVIVESKMNNL